MLGSSRPMSYLRYFLTDTVQVLAQRDLLQFSLD